MLMIISHISNFNPKVVFLDTNKSHQVNKKKNYALQNTNKDNTFDATNVDKTSFSYVRRFDIYPNITLTTNNITNIE
jgi:hypothetical protein